MARPKIVPAPGSEPAAPELIEKSIIEIAAGMRKLNSTRLKRDVIVTLLHANSGVGKREITLVLNNLEALESNCLKPAKGR